MSLGSFLRKQMKKILVIGSGGAGKSTFARRLGDLLNLEVIHLDRLYWKPGWVETPKSEWRTIVEGLLDRDAWVMDGNYSGTLDDRTAACDTIVFLDLPRSICLWRVLKRLIRHRNESRPDMAAECPEHFNWEFIRWIWGYPSRTRPKIVATLEKNSHARRIIWLRSSAAVEDFLANVRRK